MNLQSFIIKVSNDHILLSQELFISFQQTNIPKSSLSFRTYGEIYWRVETVKHAENCLTIKVIDYTPSDISDFTYSKQKSKVEKLIFERFDWQKLEPFLNFYAKISLLDILIPEIAQQNEKQILPKFGSFDNLSIYELQPQEIISNFLIAFTDIKIEQGYISFRKHIKDIGNSVDFKIENQYLLAEFDNVKSWFAKKLNTKKIEVRATVVLLGDQIKEIKARSEQIDLISPEFIDSIKYQRTYALIKETNRIIPDKELFTTTEIFTQLSTNDIEGNVFNQSEQDVLNLFIGKTGVRNKEQLFYLSEIQSKNQKILYTLKPNFGFLFLFNSLQKNYFIWELLNSHATYVWTIENSDEGIESQLKKIETIINMIRTNGREKYKQFYKENSEDNSFVVISHKLSASGSSDFSDWKNRLDEHLV